MTTERKVDLEEKTCPDHGLNVKLKAAELPKSTWYYHQNEKVDYEEKYSYLKPKLDEIIDEQSSYGRDKINTKLEDNGGLTVNQKVITGLLRIFASNWPERPDLVERVPPVKSITRTKVRGLGLVEKQI